MFKLLLPYPAALIETQKTKTLIIADPHIGWEIELQEKGIHIPSQTGKLIDKLTTLIEKYRPNSLVILGDVKYTVVKSELSEWNDVPEFFDRISSQVSAISVVKGNHDANLEPLLPDNVKLLDATGTVIGDVGVFHGHKWPSPELLGCKTLFMGHLHPVVVFKDSTGCKMTRQVWLRADINREILARTLLNKSGVKIVGSVENTLRKHFGVGLEASEIYIMPSFNELLGGKPVNESKSRREINGDSLIGPVLRSKALHIDDIELFLLDGIYLGTLGQVRKF